MTNKRFDLSYSGPSGTGKPGIFVDDGETHKRKAHGFAITREVAHLCDKCTPHAAN